MSGAGGGYQGKVGGTTPPRAHILRRGLHLPFPCRRALPLRLTLLRKSLNSTASRACESRLVHTYLSLPVSRPRLVSRLFSSPCLKLELTRRSIFDRQRQRSKATQPPHDASQHRDLSNPSSERANAPPRPRPRPPCDDYAHGKSLAILATRRQGKETFHRTTLENQN